MRIAICEDVQEDALVLKNALTRYLDSNRIAAEIDFFVSGEEFLSSFEPRKYQIIFMDIHLKEDGITGMEAAQKAYSADKDAAIVLVTTSRDHILAGYSFAQYYIVKPVVDEQIAEAMIKCRVQMERFTKTIAVTVDKRSLEIRLRDIHFITASNHDCVITATGGEATASNLKINGLAKKLGGIPFVQCHRSYVVNLLHAKAMRGNKFLMENDESVPIGRTEKENAEKAFRLYFLNKLQNKAGQ